MVLKSDGNFPVLSPAPVCYLPPPLRCRVLSAHHVLSRGRLVVVDGCLSPEAKHMGHNRKTPPILLLLLFLFSLFASPFSDKLLLTVISLTLSLIFLRLILLSHPPVSQPGLFLLHALFVSGTIEDSEVMSQLLICFILFGEFGG